MAFFHFSQLTLRAFPSRGFIIEHLSTRINDLIRRCAVIFGRVRTRVRLVLRIRRFKRPINGRQGGEFSEIVGCVTNNPALFHFGQLRVTFLDARSCGRFYLTQWPRIWLYLRRGAARRSIRRAPMFPHWHADTMYVRTYIRTYIEYIRVCTSHCPMAARVLIRLGQSILFPSFAVGSLYDPPSREWFFRRFHEPPPIIFVEIKWVQRRK